MSTNRVFRLLVSKDVAVSNSGLTPTTATDGSIVAFKTDWTQLGAAETIANSPSIFVTQRIVDSSNDKIGNITSFEINGTQVTNYRGEKFRPAAPQIAYIGLAPAGTPKTLSTGTGAIEDNSSVTYELSIINKAEKEKYQVPRRYYYNSDVSATELEIATNFADQVNADADSVVTAEVIGNGTGTSGLTSATAWGIKLKGKSGLVYWEIGLNDAWGATPIDYQVENFFGSGTYDKIHETEIMSKGYLGYLNFRTLVKPVTYYGTTQSNSALAGPATVAVTQNSCRITFNANVTSDLAVGDNISISGIVYTIASITTPSTVYELTEPYKGATNGTLAIAGVTKEEGYDMIVIDHDTFFSRPSTDGNAHRPCTTYIAIPSFLSNATALTTIQTCLNAWMASTPYRFAAAGL